MADLFLWLVGIALVFYCGMQFERAMVQFDGSGDEHDPY